jgi:hypothetical protein
LILPASVRLFGLLFAVGCMEDLPDEDGYADSEADLDTTIAQAGKSFQQTALLQQAFLCEGKTMDDFCTTQSGEQGRCIEDLGKLSCVVVYPCYGLQEGASCTTLWQSAGVCINDLSGPLYCEPQGSCVDQIEGDTCKMEFGDAGICASTGSLSYCRLAEPA